ncbi:unnamed protein product [Effrenium voratum]|nr:unnamed protein product [Effrenium voratum]
MPSAWLSAGCCCIAAAGYRYTYTRLVGNHKPPPVRVSFTLALSPAEAFTLIRNPRLLDDTTPLWFRLVIREHSKEAVADFLENSEPDKDSRRKAGACLCAALPLEKQGDRVRPRGEGAIPPYL